MDEVLQHGSSQKLKSSPFLFRVHFLIWYGFYSICKLWCYMGTRLLIKSLLVQYGT